MSNLRSLALGAGLASAGCVEPIDQYDLPSVEPCLQTAYEAASYQSFRYLDDEPRFRGFDEVNDRIASLVKRTLEKGPYGEEQVITIFMQDRKHPKTPISIDERDHRFIVAGFPDRAEVMDGLIETGQVGFETNTWLAENGNVRSLETYIETTGRSYQSIPPNSLAARFHPDIKSMIIIDFEGGCENVVPITAEKGQKITPFGIADVESMASNDEDPGNQRY